MVGPLLLDGAQQRVGVPRNGVLELRAGVLLG